MATLKPFDSYTVTMYGNNKGRTAMVACYGGDAFAGRIDFYPDGTTLPQDFLWHPSTNGEYVVLGMPMSRLEAVLSTLRVENPLHLFIDVGRGLGATTPGYGYLTTSEKEPVGEEERVV